MTTRKVGLETAAVKGCSYPGCHESDTETLDSFNGNPGDAVDVHLRVFTLPQGPYDRDLVDEMCSLGRADAASAYARLWFAREIDYRFGDLVSRLVSA